MQSILLVVWFNINRFIFAGCFFLSLLFLAIFSLFLGHRLTWRAYHRTADIFSFLDYLVATYPDLCSLRTIGYSVEKRPLKVLKCVFHF